MAELTKRQKQVLDFIRSEMVERGFAPTFSEIMSHFGFKSPKAASDHVAALKTKGFVLSEPGKARSLRLCSPLFDLRRTVADIPIFGSIPAGFGEDHEQSADGCVSVDVATIGFKPTKYTFALRVKGDSMIGRHICDGDIVVLEHGPEPRSGQIVAALIDRKSTLKTFVRKNGKPFLKAENSNYPNFIPSEDLMIQGVFRALIRKARE